MPFALPILVVPADFFSAKPRQSALRVVRRDEVHQHINRRLRIMVHYRQNRVRKRFRVRIFDVIQNCLLERVIHHAVKLPADKITSANAIAFLIRRVLPDLTVNHLVAAHFLYREVEVVKKPVGKLVRNVKPPAARAEFYPFLQNSAVPADIIRVCGIVFVNIRKRRYTPPALVSVGIRREAVPREIRAVSVAIGAGVRSVTPEFVEINRIRARMREYSVQNYVNSHFSRRFAKLREILLRSEKRVDFLVIRRRITVIFLALEYRIEINNGNSERFDVGQLFDYSP